MPEQTKEVQNKNTSAQTPSKKGGDKVTEMFEAGAHFGYRRSKTHPSVRPYIFARKNNTEIFDLERTKELLEEAKEFVRQLGRENKTIVFVGGKHSAWEPIKTRAEEVGLPYVIGRWIGGTLTNFSQTKKRVERLKQLREERDSGESARKYTKKEQLLLDREIEDLENKFGGITEMNKLPDALFIIDPQRERLAIREAKKKDIPVVALASSDCDINELDYPIIANDAAVASIKYFTEEIAQAYKEGQKEAE